MNIESNHSLHFSAAPAVACWRFHFFFQMPPSSLYYYPALLSCSLISSSSSSSFHFTNSQFFKYSINRFCLFFIWFFKIKFGILLLLYFGKLCSSIESRSGSNVRPPPTAPTAQRTQQLHPNEQRRVTRRERKVSVVCKRITLSFSSN